MRQQVNKGGRGVRWEMLGNNSMEGEADDVAYIICT